MIGSGPLASGADSTTLTELKVANLDPWEWLYAEWLMRRIANRHHCARLRTQAGVFEVCPNPAAHARDAERISPVLTAIGTLPYTPGGKPRKKR